LEADAAPLAIHDNGPSRGGFRAETGRAERI
jgi:hypothetical protein